MACFTRHSGSFRVMNRSANKFRRQVTCRSWIQATFFHAAKVAADFGGSTVAGKTVRQLVSATCLFWLVPVVGLLFLAMAAYRWAAQRLIHYIYPDEHLQVADHLSLRSAFDYSSRIQGLVTIMLVLNGLPNIKQIRQCIEDLLAASESGPLGHRAALFKSMLMTKLGILCWKSCKSFKVEDHIILHSGRWRGTGVTARNLDIFASEVLSRPFCPFSPPWEVLVVPVRQHDCRSTKYAMIFRVHHLLLNGIALRDILLSPKNCLNFPWDASDDTLQVQKSHTKLQSSRNRTTEGFWSTLYLLQKLFSMAIMSPPLIWNNISKSHPLEEINRRDDNKRLVAWSEDIPVLLLDRIKEKTGCSKNEILMACVTGALRHYFQRMAGEAPKNLLCALPLCNQDSLNVSKDRPSGILTMTLPVGKIDPVSRLLAVSCRGSEVKKQRSKTAVVTGAILNNVQRFVPSFLTRMMLNAATNNYTLLLSNVSIPSNCVTSWGNVVESIHYWRPPLANIGTSLSLVTYGDKATLGITSCPSSLLRPDVLALCFVKEVHDLALSLDIKMERRTTPPPSPCARDIL